MKINYLILTSCVVLAYILSFYYLPHEDAAILFRYAENFSQTDKISYNYNSDVAEGATDFLWMIAISFLNKIYLNSFFWSLTINFVSLFFILISLKNYFKLSNNEVVLLFISHLLIPFFWSSGLQGFSVIFIELLLIRSLMAFYNKNYLNLLFYSLVGFLSRPDFILLIFILNCFLLFTQFTFRNLIYSLIAILIVATYWFWRFKYFDLFFPLPFYVKSNSIIFNNMEWVRNLIFFSPLIILFFNQKFINYLKIRKNLAIIFSCLILPTFYYSFQDLYQNVGQRFYFYFFPVIFFIIYSFENIKKIHASFLILTISINSFLFGYGYVKEDFLNFKDFDNLYNFSKEIKVFKNIKIATTEAGILPYYSQKETVDLFGLNTPQFAQKPAGGKFLQDNNFDIIFISTEYKKSTDCLAIKSLVEISKKTTPSYYVDRASGWSNFAHNLISGIDISYYDLYLIPLGINNNKLLFINKNLKKVISVAKKLNFQNCKLI